MPEHDKIISVVKRFEDNKKDGKVAGYSLITEKFPDGYKIHPFVHKLWLDTGEKLNGYGRLCKEYLEKHPELFVLGAMILFPKFYFFQLPIFKQIILMRNLGG